MRSSPRLTQPDSAELFASAPAPVSQLGSEGLVQRWYRSTPARSRRPCPGEEGIEAQSYAPSLLR